MTMRCVVCGNPGWHDRGAWRMCTHCGLTLRVGAEADVVLADIRLKLAMGRIVLDALSAGDWTVDQGGLRNLAWAFGHVIARMDGAVAIVRPAEVRGHDVTLAIMGRGSESAVIGRQIEALCGQFARIVVLLDGAAADPDVFGAATVAEHPLDGDYAAQRNRLQVMAGAGWVLQIDTDEMPSAELCAALGWLTAAADGDGLRSLGLPRRNLVDGVLSALYPDIQYRLNRADIRFAGVVHERPVVPFAATSLALVGAIEHRLSAARVRARTSQYGGMAADGARPQDEAALLRPYDGRPIAAR